MVHVVVGAVWRQFDCFTRHRHEQVSILVGDASQDSRFDSGFAVCSNNTAVPKPAGLARRSPYNWARRFEHVAATKLCTVVYCNTMVSYCTRVPWYHMVWYHGTRVPYHGRVWYHWYHGTRVPVVPDLFGSILDKILDDVSA